MDLKVLMNNKRQKQVIISIRSNYLGNKSINFAVTIEVEVIYFMRGNLELFRDSSKDYNI